MTSSIRMPEKDSQGKAPPVLGDGIAPAAPRARRAVPRRDRSWATHPASRPQTAAADGPPGPASRQLGAGATDGELVAEPEGQIRIRWWPGVGLVAISGRLEYGCLSVVIQRRPRAGEAREAGGSSRNRSGNAPPVISMCPRDCRRARHLGSGSGFSARRRQDNRNEITS
jgi:hypothetical protein